MDNGVPTFKYNETEKRFEPEHHPLQLLWMKIYNF